jgi:hypothetical protein
MGMSQFELESHPGDAVLIAPVSGQIPRYILRLLGPISWRETPGLQPLLEQFLVKLQGKVFEEQGILFGHQGISDGEQDQPSLFD